MSTSYASSTSSGFQSAGSSYTSASGPVKIPETPSKTINKLLQQQCGRNLNTKPKVLLGQAVCTIFKVITLVYAQLSKQSKTPKPKEWIMSCGIVGTVGMLAAYLIYSVIISLAPLLNAALYYTCVAIGIAVIGLCTAGAFYFDKDTAMQEGFETDKDN